MLTPTAALVQRHDPERFATALFAPAAMRETLFTLYAFNHEIARAREVASQPLLALIRLQWWREVVEGEGKPHEVATPLRAAIAAGALDAAALLEMIEARAMEAEDAIDAGQWRAYLRGAAGALMREAGRVLGAGGEAAALTRLGAGCGAVGLLRNQAAHAALGRWSWPEGGGRGWAVAAAGALLGAPRRWPTAAVPAALPAVFARRALARLDRPAGDMWGRLAVWAAARRGFF